MPSDRASRALLALAVAALLPACTTTDSQRRGALLPDRALAALRDGVTTRVDAARLLGPPVVVARREGRVRLRNSDEPRLGRAEVEGLQCFGPLAALPPEPGDVVHLYRAMQVREQAIFDVGSRCKLCEVTVSRSSRRETTLDELYLLFDERSGLLRAHAHLRDGRPRAPEPPPDDSPPAPAVWGQP